MCLSVEAAMTALFTETGCKNRIGLGFGVFFVFACVAFHSLCLDATMDLIPSQNVSPLHYKQWAWALLMFLVLSFPMAIRSFGMSWSIMGQFIATVILLEAAPTAFQNIGYKFWIILICLTAVYAILVYFYLPEVCPNICIFDKMLTACRRRA